MAFEKITEKSSLYNDLDKMSIGELLYSMNQEDQKVPLAVAKALPAIERLVSEIVPRMKKGGRIFYMGAGTSGRLGVLDASEIPPTFGMPNTLVIGLIAGICNMIPYVGPLVGTVLAAIMGLLSGRPIKVIYAIIAMLIVQQVDNNLLAPKIVGNSVGLHAVFTMMAILVGGNIGGLIGMLIAVPVAASIRVIFNRWYDEYTSRNLE